MKEILNNQYKNLFLWYPFIMAFGAAFYFNLGTEPSFQFPILITILIIGIIYKYKNPFVRILMLFFFGFFYSMSFTHIINTPQIYHSSINTEISGKVVNLDFAPDKTYLHIRIPANQINSKEPTNKTTNIRISLKESMNINIGDTITGNATLFHPSEKWTPDSFDFSRWAYFTKLSGTGFLSEYDIEPATNTNNIRTYIHKISKSKLTDALVLGYKKAIPKKESQIWQSVGVGHVWSISGFHMTLVSTWLFALFYLIFRTISPITKRMPAKYPAIICTWIGLIFYLCISGINVSTIRAFLMATLISGAIIFNRGLLSLRNAALSFIIIFLINPFYVMHPGFQLSFAAIFGLLWFFQDKVYQKRNLLDKIFHIFYASIMTALIATIFTLPFIIAHFGYIPLYTLIGNLVILPIFSVAIMPLIMFGTIIVTLSGNDILINAANTVYNFAFKIAENITNLPYSNLHMPNIPNSALILCIFGLIFLILFVKTDSKKFIIKNLNYFICSFCITLSIIICVVTPKPLFYATSDHELVGFVVDKEIQFNKSRSAKHFFAFDTWKKLNFENITNEDNKRYKCDHGLCIYQTPKWKLAYMQNFTSIMNNISEICNDKTIQYIVTTFDVNTNKCHAKILKEGLLIYPSGKIKTISNNRPWHIQH